MTHQQPAPHAPGPKSVVEGVEGIATALLGIAKLKQSGALKNLGPFDGPALVQAVYAQISANYERGGATRNKDRSGENWRWQSLQTNIADHNKSPEVVIERAIARAACDLKREDWANQVPVASGLIAGARDGRRAIDLVRKKNPGHFELIELKIGSDTPLYAAVEILGYGCLWLLARADRPSRPSELLDATVLDLVVLAPAAFYKRPSLARIEQALDDGIQALGRSHHVAMRFAFQVLDADMDPEALPLPAERVMDAIDRSSRLHADGK